MHKNYCVENLYNVKYLIKPLVLSIVISSKLISASNFEASAIGETEEPGLDSRCDAAKFNTPTKVSKDHYIGYMENSGVKEVFNDPPVAVGVVVESEDGSITYSNKISLKEDSVYEGILGANNIGTGRTPIFGLAYKAIYGTVEIDETTGEFFYVPNNPNFRGPDSFGYFVTDNIIKSRPRKNPKHKQIFVSVQPITGGEAFKKSAKQPLWGFSHYLNFIRFCRS